MLKLLDLTCIHMPFVSIRWPAVPKSLSHTFDCFPLSEAAKSDW